MQDMQDGPPLGLAVDSLKSTTGNAILNQPVPGGWVQQQVRCARHDWRIWLPADPEQFLNELEAARSVVQVDGEPSSGSEPDVYWARLWPTALTMGAWVAQTGWPAGTHLLELGCGIGLVGLAALAAGCRVTFSDQVPIAVELARFNARQNGFPESGGLVFDWRHPPRRPFDGIVGSDILYDRSSHAALVDVLEATLRPDGIAWIGDPGRYHVAAFVDLAWDRGFDVELRDGLGRPLPDLNSGAFQLLRVRRVNTVSEAAGASHAAPRSSAPGG
jgi:predicted nicotinamide N-methyase